MRVDSASVMHKLLFGALGMLLTAAAYAAEPEQAIVVTTQGWSDVQGMAQRYAREADSRWKKVGEPFPVVVGKTGLGWGRGLSDTAALTGPHKQEGDGRAPAGIFSLTSAFGYEPATKTRLPYLPLSDSIECVDDSKSTHYNTLVDSAKVAKDWDSTEHMHRADELYHFGVFVAHNTGPATPGSGSCIFLHIWRGSDQGTVGCTAMERGDIEMLLAWLDPRKSPVLIQMPRAQYTEERAAWGMP